MRQDEYTSSCTASETTILKRTILEQALLLKIYTSTLFNGLIVIWKSFDPSHSFKDSGKLVAAPDLMNGDAVAELHTGQ